MPNKYEIHCECGEVRIVLNGLPRVKGYCHCEDCRNLLNIPYHSVTAWDKERVDILQGKSKLIRYQHPTLEMKRVYCSSCGETLYNTNAMDWRIVSQLLIRKCHNNQLPDELHSDSHFFYGRRIIDILDDLPKHD